MFLPSGENLGMQSQRDSLGGELSRCFSPVATASEERKGSSCEVVLSTSTRNLPFGDHDSPPHSSQPDSPNFRSAPPSAGTIQISVWSEPTGKMRCGDYPATKLEGIH